MRFARFPLCCVALCLPLLAGAVEQAAPQTAHETVQEATSALLVKLDEFKAIYNEEPEQFYVEIDSALSPYIDFERFARGVMAKYYRIATPEQRSQFEAMFKQDLIRTYAKALVAFDNERIDVLPDDALPEQADKEIVHMQIHGKDGSVYPVDYTMGVVEGQWKLRNVVVNGINIGLTFKNHFQQLYTKEGRDVAKVITAWSSRIGGES